MQITINYLFTFKLGGVRIVMDSRDKKILIISASLVLVLAVMFNIYRGITVSKIGIPGILEIEFDSGSDSSDGTESGNTLESNAGIDEGLRPAQTWGSTEIENRRAEELLRDRDDEISQGATNSNANGSQARPEMQRAFNVTGNWYSDDGLSYEISQSGNSVEFFEYGLWGITASGNGTLAGNQIIIDYQTAFGTLGNAVLNLSDNGQVMTGTANDLTTGVSTVLTLYKE